MTRERAADLLREQARSCAALGSGLYATLLAQAAKDAESGGICHELLAPYDAPNARADALALRLMAAVHRLVLAGEAPQLASHFPTAGGSAPPGEAWPRLHELLLSQRARIASLLELPCQTNEVGRCAALVFGFFELVARHRLPLRLLEIGASAGLNLRFDLYRYGGDGASWGPPASPVDLSGLWAEPPAALPARVEVIERAGCDLRPVNLANASDRLQLEASLWPDQPGRLARLRGAFEVARGVPARLERAAAETWLAERLAAPRAGAVSVVFHSIVEEYLPAEARARVRSLLREAGASASAEAPLAWLRLEPLDGQLRYLVTLTTWPGGAQRVVAESGPHGTDARPAAA